MKFCSGKSKDSNIGECCIKTSDTDECKFTSETCLHPFDFRKPNWDAK